MKENQTIEDPFLYGCKEDSEIESLLIFAGKLLNSFDYFLIVRKMRAPARLCVKNDNDECASSRERMWNLGRWNHCQHVDDSIEGKDICKHCKMRTQSYMRQSRPFS